MIVAAAAGRFSGWCTIIIINPLLNGNQSFTAVSRMGGCTRLRNIYAPHRAEALRRQPNTFAVHFTGNKCAAATPLKFPFLCECVCVCVSSLCPAQINVRLPQTVCHFALRVCPFPTWSVNKKLLKCLGAQRRCTRQAPFR